MADDRKISIVIPTWNRCDLLIESFIKVLYDDRVEEIVISDDASDIEIYHQVMDFAREFSKIKIYRNEHNQDCYFNKHTAICYSRNDWNIVLDSDNIIDKNYLDKIFEIPQWDENTSYMPSFAAPTFNYEQYSGITISKENINQYFDRPLFSTMCNCMNLFINKNQYQRVFDSSVNPHTADSIYFNYCWFNEGNKMYVVPGLQYEHRIHPGSHYVLNNHKTNGFYEETEKKIRLLK